MQSKQVLWCLALLLSSLAPLACNKKSGGGSASSNPPKPAPTATSTNTPTTTPTNTPTTTPTNTPTTTPTNTSTSTPINSATLAAWEINASNCALRGYGFNTETKRCIAANSQAACSALGNGSVYVLRFGAGQCVGPKSQKNAQNCAQYGHSFDSTNQACVYIRSKSTCDTLANGSLFDVGSNRCVGPIYLPTVANCAAWGAKYDSSTNRCLAVTDAQACNALASGAIFDTGLGFCSGRCIRSQGSLFNDDCQLLDQFVPYY